MNLRNILIKLFELQVLFSIFTVFAAGEYYSHVNHEITTIDAYVKSETESGVCGENLTWKWSSSDRTLTICGSGKMYNYLSRYFVPWYGLSVTGAVSRIVLSESITSIGSYAFYGFRNVNGIYTDSVSNNKNKLPSALGQIGSHAFYGCCSLGFVSSSSSEVNISDSAFENCSLLYCADFSGSIKFLGNNAFRNCTSLRSVTYIDEICSQCKKSTGIFSDCKELKSINNKPLFALSEDSEPVIDSDIKKIIDLDTESFQTNIFLNEYADIYSRWIVKKATAGKYAAMTKAQLAASVMIWIRSEISNSGGRNKNLEFFTLAYHQGMCTAQTQLYNHILLTSGRMIRQINPAARNAFMPDDIYVIQCNPMNPNPDEYNHNISLVNISQSGNCIWLPADSTGRCFFNNTIDQINPNKKISTDLTYYPDGTDGIYSDMILPAKVPSLSVFGDVNNDGLSDLYDAAIILKSVLHSTQADSSYILSGQKSLSDVNLDGTVDTDDAVLIIRYAQLINADFPDRSQISGFWINNSLCSRALIR